MLRDAAARAGVLPVVLYEHEIVEAVRANPVTVICGDTGCGKSTQVPRILLESGGFNGGGMIGITQPRRLAAVSLAKRVQSEIQGGEDIVGYQVRYRSSFNRESCRIKYMTDGILLRELQRDITLKDYSVIIIDEAHERSINCDLILSLIASGTLKVRNNTKQQQSFKLIIMSATIRISDFLNSPILFPPQLGNKGNSNEHLSSEAALVQIDSRTFPITIHYEKQTTEDYVSLAVEKTLEIHKKLPPGSILVFLTGKREVHDMCNRLLSKNTATRDCDYQSEDDHDDSSSDTHDVSPQRRTKQRRKLDEQRTSIGVSSSTQSFFIGGEGRDGDIKVFPLYAQMGHKEQERVCNAQSMYPNHRIVIVATNVAETSLTIPNVRYVIDSGREKRREFQHQHQHHASSSSTTTVSRFVVRFISKSSANQRAGRAGRVGPGHVYRLYSTNVFGEYMSDYPLPEITQQPLDSVILLLKGMGIPSVTSFPWAVSTPPILSIQSAINRLYAINALTGSSSSTARNDSQLKVSSIGKELIEFPIHPRYALMIHLASQKEESSSLNRNSLLLCACFIASAFSCGDIIPASTAGNDTLSNNPTHHEEFLTACHHGMKSFQYGTF